MVGRGPVLGPSSSCKRCNLADPAEAVDAAAELVNLGKQRWDSERLLRLAGEAVIGRLGDIATKLPDAD